MTLVPSEKNEFIGRQGSPWWFTHRVVVDDCNDDDLFFFLLFKSLHLFFFLSPHFPKHSSSLKGSRFTKENIIFNKTWFKIGKAIIARRV